jgi:hypothetical protein
MEPAGCLTAEVLGSGVLGYSLSFYFDTFTSAAINHLLLISSSQPQAPCSSLLAFMRWLGFTLIFCLYWLLRWVPLSCQRCS